MPGYLSVVKVSKAVIGALKGMSVSIAADTDIFERVGAGEISSDVFEMCLNFMSEQELIKRWEVGGKGYLALTDKALDWLSKREVDETRLRQENAQLRQECEGHKFGKETALKSAAAAVAKSEEYLAELEKLRAIVGAPK